MKKLIALVISASVIAAPVAFAADETPATTDATAQQMTTNQAPAAKPAAKHHAVCKYSTKHTCTAQKLNP